MPPEKPVEVRAVVSYDQLTIRNAQTENDRNHATQESIKKATWFAFVAVSIYALITLAMWFQMIKQNRIARDALSQSEKQWKSQQVPWLGLQNNAISISPTPKFSWSRVPSLPPSIWLAGDYSIKNFGNAPAFREWELIHVMQNTDGHKPTDFIEFLCPMRVVMEKRPSETDSDSGQILFPGAEKYSPWSTAISPHPTGTHIESVWIVLCVSYEDSWHRVRHSRFVYESLPGPGSHTAAVIPDPAHPDWTYVPIKSLALIDAEADQEEKTN